MSSSEAAGRISGIQDNTLKYAFKLQVHIMRRNDGTRRTWTIDSKLRKHINEDIEALNNYFDDIGIIFISDEQVNYIDNTELYDYQLSDENALVSNNNAGAINIYYVDGPFSYTRFHNVKFIVISLLGGFTLTHEMGHLFCLWHTFGKSNGDVRTDELVSRTVDKITLHSGGTTTQVPNGIPDCQETGDEICDMPADPFKKLNGLPSEMLIVIT